MSVFGGSKMRNVRMKITMLMLVIACLLFTGCGILQGDAVTVNPLPDTTMDNLTDAILSVSLAEGDAYVDDTGKDRVIAAVKNAAGSADAQYYRSIAILLINTNEQAGSTGYPFREKADFVNGYASFAIAALAANSTGTNGLIKHEAGGHAFGRLADEYYSGSETVTDAKKKELDDWHKKGWYWNVTSSTTAGYYMFTRDAYTGVGFVEGAWGYKYGLYCPTVDGMMQGNTGNFNAPCRHAIYHRIITESEGVEAYAFWKFAQYDLKNR